jgi:hypothetical protein
MRQRVDVLLPHGVYAEYTSKKGVDSALAASLGAYLRLRKAGGRIVDVASGKVLEEWERLYVPQPALAVRDAVDSLRKLAGL